MKKLTTSSNTQSTKNPECLSITKPDSMKLLTDDQKNCLKDLSSTAIGTTIKNMVRFMKFPMITTNEFGNHKLTELETLHYVRVIDMMRHVLEYGFISGDLSIDDVKRELMSYLVDHQFELTFPADRHSRRFKDLYDQIVMDRRERLVDVYIHCLCGHEYID